jgi:chromosome segregation ATPase
MSHDINHIMNAISEANRALQEEPNYKHRIFSLEQESEARRQRVQHLEITIAELRDNITNLNNEVRALEVARDDAQFHQLEAQDKADQAVAVLNSIVKNAQDYIVAVSPPPPVEPETVKEPEPLPLESTVTESNEPEKTSESSPTDKGQSEANPTATSNVGDSSQTVPTVPSTESASSDSPPQDEELPSWLRYPAK